MAKNETGKEVEKAPMNVVETSNPEPEEKPKSLLQIAEVRMVLYVIPVALAIWLFAYIYEHYLK
jgi:hypothetical protein